MNKRFILLALLIVFTLTQSVAQTRLGVYAAGFYNLENLFDTEDDPDNPGDDEFLPNGPYSWTPEKYQQKLRNMAKVIAKLAREKCPGGPAILGVSEVENRRVLEDLVKTEPLASMGYEIVHYDSPDRRGIDVACLYNPRLFTLLSSKAYPFFMPSKPNYRSRDQLLVSGLLAGESFHMIVNHWPSRYGGDRSSIYREAAAAITKHIADSIHAADPQAKVLIVGDMNDDPTDKSTKEVLKARRKAADTEPDGYFNATWPLFDKGIGTLCYQDKWNLYDQLIISGNLLGKDRSTLKFWKAEIFNRDFLTTQEGKRKGYPWRTFSSNTFINGYSDHFPALIYFVKEIR